QLPIYIIINQVDKHNEAELHFTEYDKKVKQTFDQWGIFPEAIYYSTVMEPENDLNQLTDIKQQLFQMMDHAHHHQMTSQLQHAFNTVVKAHQTFIREKLEEAISETSMDAVDKEEMDRINNRIIEIDKHKDDLKKG